MLPTLNIRSRAAHFDQLSVLVQQSNYFNLIIIIEIWPNAKLVDGNLYILPNYKSLTFIRAYNREGGKCILIKNMFNAIILQYNS